MESLKEIIQILKQNENSYNHKYFIPQLWNVLNYDEHDFEESRPNEISVNPYRYYTHYFEFIIDQANILHENDEMKIEKSIIYSLMTRLFTAWNHRENHLEYGTFFKTIALLPYLKQLHIDVIYLLPIFRCGEKYQKGSAGSVYSIKNLYKLDTNLHDSLLGECTDELLELQFKAFVEACHALGIKVMVDFVMRTTSRDSDILLEHPNWFYWIDEQHKDEFKPIVVENEPELTYLKDDVLESIYASKGLKKYLGYFKYPPRLLEGNQYRNLVDEKNINILELIERDFHVTTAPAFSDVINDYQDPWFDVTYFKLSFNLHKKIDHYTESHQPPYILQDIAKANLYCGDQINYDLWKYLEGVIPYYQNKFDIDGARIDMAHALPQELNNMIISSCREINKLFILWSEEFSIDNSEYAKGQGYNFLTGEVFRELRRFEDENFMDGLLEYILKSKIPVMSALETPDTLRIPTIYKNKKIAELLIVLSFLLPNSVPIINNGMEIDETMPMNTGLDNLEKLKDILEHDIEYLTNNLPFFNKSQLMWNKASHYERFNLLKQATKFRYDYRDAIGSRENLVYSGEVFGVYSILIQNVMNGNYILIIINITEDLSNKIVTIKSIVNEIAIISLMQEKVTIVFQNNFADSASLRIDENINLDPFEIMVFIV